MLRDVEQLAESFKETFSEIYLEQIARTCHEVNRLYCDSIGDSTQTDWGRAPEWQRTSALISVQKILDNPGLTPVDLHETWCEHKKSGGWVFGEVKDPEKKTHPALVPYTTLPKEQVMKDYLFHTIVRSFM